MAHYSAKEVMAIATTINNQINATTYFWVRGSWGISRRVATTFNEMAALALRVSGVYHKGWVYICYNEGSDAYDLFFVNTRGTQKKVIEMVYADVLGEVLDINIERGVSDEDTYAKKAMADTAKKYSRA